MTALTATSSVPSGTTIFASVPSSTASTSMVALSVSISAMTSPDLTVSPSFFSHLARLPFSMVGDSAGMRMLIGMASALLPGGFSCQLPGRLRCDFFAARLGRHRTRAHLGGERLRDLDGDVFLAQARRLRRVDRTDAVGNLGQHLAPLRRRLEGRQRRDIEL